MTIRRTDLIFKYLFPDKVDGVDYELEDDSDGLGIKIIRCDFPGPTEIELWENENKAILHFEAIEDDKIARKELEEIDKKTIRGIREFLIDRFGADETFPALLGDLETAAVEHRKKVKKT